MNNNVYGKKIYLNNTTSIKRKASDIQEDYDILFNFCF